MMCVRLERLAAAVTLAHVALSVHATASASALDSSLDAKLPHAGAPCTTAADCSLNGDCINSVCVCDAQWRGSPSCDVLALLPTDKSRGYHNSAQQSSWGGLPLRDESSNQWHLFAAQMLDGCSLQSWKNNSVVVRAVSSNQDGPFQWAEVVLPPFSHNPKPIQAPDGTFLIYGIGGGMWRTTPANCGSAASEAEGWGRDSGGSRSGSSKEGVTAVHARPAWGEPLVDPTDTDPSSPTQDGCGPEPPLNGGCGIFIASSSSLLGPWTVQPLVIEDQNRSTLLQCTHTNPSPAFLANGSVLMAFNAGWCNNHLETIGLATAPHWSGPYTLLTPDPILRNSDGTPHQCEDPSLWVDKRGYHLLVHNQQGPQVGMYAHSVDGFAWTLHDDPSNPGPYNRTIVWSDGTTDTLEVERPQLVWSADGSGPTFLINGAEYGNGTSFTLFRPIAQA